MNGPAAFALAFGAGLLSFLSPCTLPLLPGYLSYISGLGADEMQERNNAGLLLGTAALFVLGFSLVFVASGATASYIGSALGPHRITLTRVAGVFIVIMGLFMAGIFRLPTLYGEKRFHLQREFGIWSAFPLGIAFGFGWSPCIGPILTAIDSFAMAQGTAQWGALLLFVYSLGLGVPFLLVALFTGRVLQSLNWFKRYYGILNVTGGAVLVVMGIFLVLNQWTVLLGPAMRWYANLNLPT